jgi:hypothetical protein
MRKLRQLSQLQKSKKDFQKRAARGRDCHQYSYDGYHKIEVPAQDVITLIPTTYQTGRDGAKEYIPSWLMCGMAIASHRPCPEGIAVADTPLPPRMAIAFIHLRGGGMSLFIFAKQDGGSAGIVANGGYGGSRACPYPCL